ncbi:MAG: helix-turn-helix domain-containing protein [Mesorhizobium sp.]|nr:MAG: helix-turn-helix domain-containing protein [Mesorhizobium sp.]
MDMLNEAAEKPKDDADVRVGRRVRALRLERNLSLAELAAKAGVSIGALSQIERGLSSLRVKVIWPLAAALDIEPSALITDGNDAGNDLYCVRANSRRQIPVKSEGIAKALLSPPAATLTGMLVTVEAGGGTVEAYAHPGEDFPRRHRRSRRRRSRHCPRRVPDLARALRLRQNHQPAGNRRFRKPIERTGVARRP